MEIENKICWLLNNLAREAEREFKEKEANKQVFRRIFKKSSSEKALRMIPVLPAKAPDGTMPPVIPPQEVEVELESRPFCEDVNIPRGYMEDQIWNRIRERYPEVDRIDEKGAFDKWWNTAKWRIFSSIPAVKEIYRENLLRNLYKAGNFMESAAASLLLNAFDPSKPGLDGKPLCALDHPIGKTGRTYPNMPPTPVSLPEEALGDVYENLRSTPDDEGRPYGLTPKYLVVSPKYFDKYLDKYLGKYLAMLPQSRWRIEKSRIVGLEIIKWDPLDDMPTAWFVLADHHNLYYFVKQEPCFRDLGLEAFCYIPERRVFYSHVVCEIAVGFTDWRGVYGAKAKEEDILLT